MLSNIASSFLVLVALLVYFSSDVVSAEKVISNTRRFDGRSRSLQSAVVGKVDKLILYNAVTDLPLFILTEGMVVNTAILNVSTFNVIATVDDGTVGSIKFGYNGKDKHRTETKAPYTLCGGTVTDYNVCTYLVVGRHNITVTT